jgi:hypothetical protein
MSEPNPQPAPARDAEPFIVRVNAHVYLKSTSCVLAGDMFVEGVGYLGNLRALFETCSDERKALLRNLIA